MNGYLRKVASPIALSIGAIAGACVASALYGIALSSSEAIGVIQSGRVGGMESVQTKITPQLVVDRRGSPQLLIDLMQTPAFTKLVAVRAGVPDLAQDLAAIQYGGRGKLKTRPISDGSLVEIRAKADTPAVALELVKATLSLGVEEDKSTLENLRSILNDRVKELELEKARLSAVASAMIQLRDDGSSFTDPKNVDASAAVLTRLQATDDNLWAIRTGLSQPMSQESKVFADAALVRPLVSNWWKAALAGLPLGAALVFSIRLLIGRARLVTRRDGIDFEPTPQ